ncbi:choice-of-anchor Q domain-containing protein [Hydrogenivirga sp. 128-5-R1-1]|uniref:InlB B-repeat-containing protein n=1 Tax=Hydrogenivirga sp. 128-5-R1-1 TaxID=392423 RepID=UPI00015EF91A|nr:choice-of-anchor Q domain-containing protein [Hydrogenivirga sp. 128-5-R1-1]EDP75321.1 thiamine biosynthesis protein ThiC [Hydrogenivirga sp. 128-5-R1-1]
MQYGKLSLILGSALFCTGLSMSADFYVAPSAQGTGDCSSQANACEFSTALSNVGNNGEADTIFVSGGTYELTSTLQLHLYDNKPLTIKALDPYNKPVLDGDPDNDPSTSNSVQVMLISTDIVSVIDTDVIITIENLIFQNGGTDKHGGGLYIPVQSAEVNIEGCEFKNNEASVGSNTWDGGGLYIFTRKNSKIKVSNSYFIGNKTGNGGGGAFITCAGTCDNPVTVENNVFKENSTRDFAGGLRISSFKGAVSVVNNVFYKNSSEGIGGLSADGKEVLLLNNTFSENTDNGAGLSGGGAVIFLVEDTDKAYIYNNVFWNNTTADPYGDDLSIYNDQNSNGTGSPVELKNNIFSGNAKFNEASDSNPGNGRLESGDLYIRNTDSYTQSGNTNGDPQFVDQANGDLRLSDGSPAMDTGTDALPTGYSLPTTDINGNDRAIDGDGDGTATVDMGAYEFGMTLTITKSGSGSGDVTSNPNTVDCGSTCSKKVGKNLNVTLTATPDSGSQFSTWEGDCSSCGNNTDCTITLDANKSCNAVFALVSGGTGGGGGGGGGCSSSPVSSLPVWSLVPVLMFLRRLLRR